MSKVFAWWLEQICSNCSNTNEECICVNDVPTDPRGEIEIEKV